MKKIAFVGGPSTGKSSTFKDLQIHLPDAKFHPEAAREVIKEDHTIIQRQQELQTKINQRIIQSLNDAEDGLNFYDRALPDQAVYDVYRGDLKKSNLDKYFAVYDPSYKYDLTIFFPFNPSFYELDKERHENIEQAKQISQITKYVYSTYKDSITKDHSELQMTNTIEQRTNTIIFLLRYFKLF